MSLFQALILGLVQGLTEFFPVSSSAHLRLAKWLLGIQDGEHLLPFDLFCHFGTLLALLWYLRKDVWKILSSFRSIALYFLALIPLIPAYFLLSPLRKAVSHPAYLGFALIFTAFLLFSATLRKETKLEKKWKDVLCIGLMQTLALVPGISRSGSTISAARLLGWNWLDAARFSFLLAIPTILGGEILELMKHGIHLGASPSCYIGGFTSSLLCGLLSVRFVFAIYEKERVAPFAWYCLILGIIAWALYHG